jgi:iron complex outermembrane receptor protein
MKNGKQFACKAIMSTALVMASSTALAQLEEIVVTAQRRSENIQNVPISVSAITADTLESLGAQGVMDLSSTAPGLYVGRQLASPLIYIRGIGTTSTQGGQESPTALYVDGVYYHNLPGLNFSFNNIERIEVLKGPQGTLFGRNATGGLVQIITKDPSEDTSVKVGMSVANYDTIAGKLYATTGFGENLAADIAFVGSDQDKGWGRNTTLDIDTGWTDDYGVRSTWLWTPTDKTNVRTSLDWANIRTTVGLSRQADKGARTVDGLGPDPDYFNEHSNFRNLSETTSRGAAVKVTHSFGNLDLVSITAYRKTKTDLTLDQDSTALPLIDAPIYYRDRSFSQELQLVSQNNDRFQWIAGLYYTDVNIFYRLNLQGAALAALGGRRDVNSDQPLNSYAGFAQATWGIGSAGHLTVGARYTEDKRKLKGFTLTGTGAVIPSSAPPKTTQSEPTWRLAYDHRFNEQFMAYASYNRGFKSGLYNMVNLDQAAVDPELVDAYEIGFKSDLFDGRMRLNGTAFFYDYKDLQVQVIQAGITVLQNAAEAESRGIELELQAAPTNNLTLFAGLAWLDTEYKSFPNAQVTVPPPPPAGGNIVSTGDVSGNDLVRAPKLSGSFAFDYRLPSSVGEWGISGSYVHTGKFYWEPDNRRRHPAVGLVNGELGWTSIDERWRLYVFGRNLTDKEYSQFTSGGQLGDQAAPAAPRTYGLGVDFTFK